MRGKRHVLVNSPRRNRITPAGAGKTSSHSALPLAPWDHPRRCGENFQAQQQPCNPLGSPPQVRGKLSVTDTRYTARRITPAGAGKTRSARLCRRQLWDHPRRCGENSCVHHCKYYPAGSPPQVRGKLGRALGMAGFGRITPAGAGKTHFLRH